MKRILSALLILTLVLPAAALAAQADPAAEPRAVIELLSQGNFAQVFEMSSADVQKALGTADSLAVIWAQLGEKFGEYGGILSAAAQEKDGYNAGSVVCSYALAEITFSVVLDSDGKIVGFTVAAVKPVAPESTADATKFVAEPITLRQGAADETNGILTLPTGDGPFPAVIMMQGSGSTDMNETAYGMAAFRDIAEGLALAGVASIRYDKYTYAHADMLKNGVTVQQEYIDDAQAALALLEADSRIRGVYLLGHSEGAMLVPRVMQALGAEHFAGGVLLDGSPLPMWEIQYHQNLALLSKMEESKRDAAKLAIETETAKAAQIPNLTGSELNDMTFFGVPAAYQKDLMSVDAAQTALALQKPLLIVQGGKDWQVTPADGIDAWQAALGDKLPVAYKLYPDMNHMLSDMDSEPTGTTADYTPGSKVSPTLIGDVAAWIKGE